MKAIKPDIPVIVGMLLPEGYLPILRGSAFVEPTSPGVRQATHATTESNDSDPALPPDSLNKPPSWMMGPACALRILAQNSEFFSHHLTAAMIVIGFRDVTEGYTRHARVRQSEALVFIWDARR